MYILLDRLTQSLENVLLSKVIDHEENSPVGTAQSFRKMFCMAEIKKEGGLMEQFRLKS